MEILKEKLYGSGFKFQDSLKLNLKDLWGYEEEEFGFELEEELPEVPWDPNIVDYKDPKFEPGFKYLRSRGLDDRHVMEYDIRYNPVSKRVIFPVKVNNRLLGWQGRYIENTTFVRDGREIHLPKVVTSTGLKKDLVLMFQDRLKGRDHCILTEGPVSALKANLCGGNVASMGKNVSDKQLDIIVKSVPKLYLGLDPDAAKEIDTICRKLYGKIKLYHLPPPPGREDLGDATEEEVLCAYRSAEELCGQFHMYLRDS